MTTIAIVMMVLFLLIVWGGLVVSIWYLRGHPTPYSDIDDDEDENLATPHTPVTPPPGTPRYDS